ncbi:MAG TPA: hypothetical protein VMW50_09290 [Dehalococcoidia bacterium]|nr:hypothetical protein [Dehalococcoidia bacterium]
MATSGTVGSTIFTNQQIIDHAFRRCKMVEQQITGEHLQIALELLWLFTQTLVNKGIKLWNVVPIILPIYEREQTVPCPLGTVDTYTINLRTLQRITGIATASEGVAQNAFDGNVSTACVQTLPLGTITMTLPSPTAASTFGILPNATGLWSYVIEVSNDNFVTAIPLITKVDQPVVAGEWLWADVQGVTAYQYYRLRATGVTILDVLELVYQDTPNEIPMYKLNRNDYANLPDKVSTGRPTQFWYDKQRTQPQIELWPSPQFQFTFSQITGFVQRQLQDVGTMADELEVPDRWYLAMVCNLAAELGRELKEVEEIIIPRLDLDAEKYLADAWTGETDDSEVYLRPAIAPYTR